jgi:hypothetical protein
MNRASVNLSARVTRAALEARLAACEDALNAVSAVLASPYVRVEHELLGEVTPQLSREVARYWNAVTDPGSAACDLCGALAPAAELCLIGPDPRMPAIACGSCAKETGWPQVPGESQEAA